MAVDLNGKQLPKGIHQRENGLYVGRFKFQKQSYVFYDRNLEQLQRILEDKKYEVRHGLYTKENNITVDAWFNTWMQNYKTNLKANSIYTYEQAYGLYIKPTFGEFKLKDIRSEMIQALINQLFQQGKSRSRINIVYVIFLGMYKKAVALNMVNRNPVNAVEFPKNKIKNKLRVMTVEEQATFLQYAQGRNYYDIYLLALSTGMRIGEILALRWSDVDFPNRTVTVNGTLVYISSKDIRFIDTPKSLSSQREIPMLDQVFDMLTQRKLRQEQFQQELGEKWKEEPGLENLVFTYDAGGAYWDASVRTEIAKIVKTINNDGMLFEKITPHTFRHTFATRGLENGIPPKVMQSILGHSSLAMTMDKYSHVLPNTKAKEMEKINSFFKLLDHGQSERV